MKLHALYKTRLPGNRHLVLEWISARLNIAAVEPRGLVKLTGKKEKATRPRAAGQHGAQITPWYWQKSYQRDMGIVVKGRSAVQASSVNETDDSSLLLKKLWLLATLRRRWRRTET